MSVVSSKSLLLIALIGLSCAGNGFSQTPVPTPLPDSKSVEDARAKDVAFKNAQAAGNAAFNKKEFDAAISIYDAAVTANPTHPDVPTILVNKAYAQFSRGRDLFNTGIATMNIALRESGKTYLRSAAETSAKSLALARSLNYEGIRLYSVIVVRVEIMHAYATRVEPNATIDALLAFNDYFAIERNPQKAVAAHIDLGSLLASNGSLEAAKEEFEMVLEYTPKNPRALFGLAETLLKLGQEKSTDKKILQRSANTFKAYLAVAPAGDAKVKEANDHLVYLKETHKIVPK